MKKTLILIGLILLSVCLFACSQVKITEKSGEDTYVFEGENKVNVDDRSFFLEEAPENMAEEVIVKEFLYTITADYATMSNILADTVSHGISIENEKKAFKEGIYIQSLIIHKISTLTEEEYNVQELEGGERNHLYYYGWEEVVDKYKLTEHKIINVQFTQTHSRKSNELGPQWGDGAYNRSFIVGRTAEDSSYKIYDFGMM